MGQVQASSNYVQSVMEGNTGRRSVVEKDKGGSLTTHASGRDPVSGKIQNETNRHNAWPRTHGIPYSSSFRQLTASEVFARHV